MAQRPPRLLVLVLSAVVFVAPAIDTALACTRTLYVGANNTVITGRNMDWMEDMASNLWVFPAGLKRDGAAGRNRYSGRPNMEAWWYRDMKPAALTA
jgi:penicillin V acylase-like amidase (Ntn superfamily)